MQSTAACLFIWNVLRTINCVPKRVSVDEARLIVAQMGKPAMIPSASMLEALDALSRHDAQLSSLVAFVDASGEAWRGTLNVLLAPLGRVQMVLSKQNATGKAALLVRSSGEGVGAEAETLDDEAVRQAVLACKTLARLFVKSYSVDVYGVVQRTLPATLVCLLKLKEEIALWLKQPTYGVKGGLRALGVAGWVGVASRRRLVEVVDDELVRCVYTIVGRFDKFLKSFLSGKEYEWDGSANECLEAFLRVRIAGVAFCCDDEDDGFILNVRRHVRRT
ncbi:hypothetical protein FGB62_139g017 [Gracilaria domingensis]|nr:hypothetical protein FGB62_139g017 [Gracilaria domingensis]